MVRGYQQKIETVVVSTDHKSSGEQPPETLTAAWKNSATLKVAWMSITVAGPVAVVSSP
jgi:hypothetical protein